MKYTVFGKRKYDIEIVDDFSLLVPHYDRNVFFIVDKNVDASKVMNNFNSYHSYELVALEDNKSLYTYSEIIRLLTFYNYSKTDLIIAIGGGICLDIAGFVSSSYKRGIDCIFIPTTLLAMVDASVGSKNGLNYGHFKNMIGSFYDPINVLIHLDFLKTLDKEELDNGLIEALKMGICFDEELVKAVVDRNYPEIVERSIKIKTDIVNCDYYDEGKRHFLNFGHTIAHAIELLNPKFKHGFAVGAGMLFFIDDEEKKKIVYDILKSIYDVDEYLNFVKENAYQILDAINQDKKVRTNKVYCVVYSDSINVMSLEIDEIYARIRRI